MVVVTFSVDLVVCSHLLAGFRGFKSGQKRTAGAGTGQRTPWQWL